MATVKARVEHLLKEAKDYDPDKRYMAANDLCAELLKDQEPIEGALVKQICSVFLTQLDDISIDVQGNAVRCIKKIISKIQETQVSEVIGKLGDCLKNGKEEFRDIYATCLKGLISDVPESYANVVCDTMMPILQSCILGGNPNVAEEALEILTDLVRKFPSQLHTNADRTDLVNGITNLLINPKSSIKKKSISCIGAVSMILPLTQLQTLVAMVIRNVSNRNQKLNVYSWVQALGAISRSVGEKLTKDLRVLFEILSGYCETSGLDLESSTIETDYELIETCLNAIECLVKRCAKDISEYIPKVMALVLNLSTYDPNYSYVEAEEEVDDDWGSDENDSDYGNPADDSSWKIRRAALNIMDAVIKSRPEILSGYYTPIVESLVKGFKEREENVKLDVFRTFSTLIKSVVIGDIDSLQGEELPTLLRTRSSAEVFQDLLPMIVQEVSRELGSKSIRTRQAVTSFLVDLSLSYPLSLSDNLNLIQPGLVKNLEDMANSTLRINTLMICKRIFRGNSPNNIHLCYAMLPQIQAAVRDSYYKITAEALKLIGNIVKVLPNETRFILEVFPLVLEKLSFTDIDQEVKQATIYSTATIISAASNHLQANSVKKAMELITDRLKNEVTRGACLKAWIKISQSHHLPAIDSPLLKSLCDELQGLLKKSLRSLKLSTLDALMAIAKSYNCPNQSCLSILADLPGLIGENDLHLSQSSLSLIEIFVTKGIRPAEDTLNSLIKSMHGLAISALAQGGALSSLCLTYKSFVQHLRLSPNTLIEQLLKTISQQRKSLENSAHCIAAICQATPASFTQGFITTLLNNVKAKNESSNISALCIGEIGITQDLSRVPNIAESLTELFESKIEETKVCASVALGKLAVGNLERFLPLIFSEFSVEAHRYLLLNSIEEVITYKSEHMAPYISQILPVLFENAERSEENVRNISAECLGKLVSVSPDKIIPRISEKIHTGSLYCKTTMVSSIKYTAHLKIHGYSEYMERILPQILECLSIADVNLRRACLISLNSIAHNSPSALKHNFHLVCEKVFAETVMKQELIKKVDLGAFTHVTDEGLPIRKAAYGVIETFIEQLPEKIDANRVLDHVIQGLDDSSDEVQMLCHQLLSKLMHWASGAVAGNLNTIITHIRKNVEKNHKLLNSKQEVERATDVLRSALRCVEKVETQIEVESSVPFKEFLTYVAGVPELSSILHTIKSQRESLLFI
ncbi:hypothetical protein SteCoe_15817 [Stentor coeruleus]|uniref:TATA-binding protein interacting (TIP20) domain-containing protein n=1 Tax=Stentor coeruleus TaxID=5963 RepID=A0A1R2C2N8_9CILI|nr:hypothetical protein SteCoe_15817 [Stentor coeruleus]